MDKYAAEHILGLSGAYDAKALKAAYRTMAARHHPDAARARGENPSEATIKMQEVNEAHEFLSGLFTGTVRRIVCDDGPSVPPTGNRNRGYAPASNPFEGRRSASASYRARQRPHRQTTAQYYADDPRAHAYRRQGERQDAAPGQTGNGFAWGAPEPLTDDPAHPLPRWYARAYRFLARFPYRFMLLLAVCLLVNVTDPAHVGHTMGPFTFEEFLLFLSLANLVFPFITGPLRALLLHLVNGLAGIHP